MTLTTTRWLPDHLGRGFEAATFELHPDPEGRVVTTLIRHVPRNDPNALTPATLHTPFVFLAIHGWNDYFFQRELAREISAMGGSFYAIDLRKYGRSHIEGQSWGYITDLSDYDEELHIALDQIYSDHGSQIPIVLYGHSTGGLTASLWADRHPGALSALILNSPWIALQGTAALRLASQSAIDALNKLAPHSPIPLTDNGFYMRTLAGNHLNQPDLPEHAASDPFFTTGAGADPRYKNADNFLVRAGWLSAILNGHRTVAQGLQIDVPTLVLTAAESSVSPEWNSSLLASDSVLTVENIWKRVPFLGAHTTLIKIPQAIHDVILSRASARELAFSHIRRFLGAWLEP